MRPSRITRTTPAHRGFLPGLRPGTLVPVLVVAALGACLDGASGPDGSGVGYFALAPLLPAAVQDGQFPLGVDGIGLRMLRSETGEVVVDTMIPFDPDSSEVHLAVRVGMLRRVEEFEARLSLQAGTLVLFSGSKLIFLQQGPPGTNGVDTVNVHYQGPGRDIAAIAIQPPEAIIRLGDSLQFRVAAVDSGGAPVPQFFVSWSASDATPGRLNAFGWLRALNARSAVTVTATTPNGAADTARAVLVPAPTGLRLVGADTVAAPVGTAAGFAVRVVAADSLGVPGVPVHFSAATAGGSVTDSVVMSDSAGFAATQVLIGDTLRVYGYEARAEGLETGHLTVDAVAGPAAAVAITAGNTQSAPVATELPTPLAVRVRDARGNAVAGQRVNFVVTSGGGSVWAGSNNTNDSGIAMERWTLGTSTALPQRLEARAVDNATGAPLVFASFSATALPGPADSVSRAAGDGQTGTVGEALAESLAVRVVDRFGNPVPGVGVQWGADVGTVTVGSGSSDAQGISRAAWVMGQLAGVYHATATASPPPAAQLAAAESLDGGTVRPSGPTGAGGLGMAAGPQAAGLAAVFSATAEAGAPAQVTVSGSGTTLTALGSQLTLGAQVRDAFGNVISNPTLSWSSSDTSVAVVAADGLVTARGKGTVRVTATAAGSVAGFADLTVAQTVVTGTLTPEQATLGAVGASVQLQLTALDANGNPVSDPAVTWSSSDVQVATVSPGGLVTAVGPGSVTITATVSGSVVDAATLSVTVSVVPSVAGIEVSPQTGTLTALGATLSLQATAVDAQGSPVTGVLLTWHSSDGSVATVSSDGVVTAVANGIATIAASTAGFTGSAQITVAQVVSAVDVSPAAVSLGTLGATAQLSATLEDANGHAVSAPVTWSSSPPGVVSVDQQGLVTAVGNGTATVTASSGGKAGSAVVTVSLPPAKVTVVIRVGAGDSKTIQPGSQGNTPVAILTTSTASGEPVTFDARTVDAGTVRVAGAAPVNWSPADVDGDGDTDLQLHFTTADLEVTVGSVTVTLTGFTTGGTAIEGQETVTVLAPPSAPPAPAPPQAASVDVAPQSLTLTALGSSEQLAATVHATDMSVLGGATVTWSSSDPGVASVDATGLVTAVANGTTTVTASSDGVSGSAGVTVSQQAVSVAVDPASASLAALGTTVQLSAAVEDANGHPMSAPVTWTSSAPGVAGVDQHGLVTAAGNGSATITAGSGAGSGSATITVSQVPAAVAVSPATISFTALGATAQLGAVVADANGQPIAGAGVAWATSDPAVATVGVSGLVTAAAGGETWVTATVGDVSGAARVTVSQTVAMVTLLPSSVTLTAPGATQQLQVNVADANGYPVGGSVTWTSSNGAVAAVSASGWVTAVGNGTATVTATSGGVSASVLVNVTMVTPPLTVAVLVRPDGNDWWVDRGGKPRPINLDADGVTMAAILTTSTRRGEIVSFDARSVDVATVRLAGAAPVGWAFRDLRHDGDWDLVLRFRTRDLQLTQSSTKAVLEGRTYSGQAIRGEADVWIVPPLFWWFSKGK